MNNEFNKIKEDYKNIKMSEEQVEVMKKAIEKAKENKKKTPNYFNVRKMGFIAASIMGLFVLAPNISPNIAYAMENIPVIGKLVQVVTFREYRYEDDRNEAMVDVPKLVIKENLKDEHSNEKLEKSTEEINKEINEIKDQLIKEFKDNMKKEVGEGYQSIDVKFEIVTTTPDYFTLKLICFRAVGSGYEKEYFYTVDLNTGERLALKDVFEENADYETVLTENIKDQMREQMKSEGPIYFLDSDMPDWDFKGIDKNNAFYINEKNHLVICFNEGEVGPASMGSVEFEIPEDAIDKIRVLK